MLLKTCYQILTSFTLEGMSMLAQRLERQLGGSGRGGGEGLRINRLAACPSQLVLHPALATGNQRLQVLLVGQVWVSHWLNLA